MANMAENLSSPIFADRYRFQTVGTDWDRGRSGFTHLVFDIKKERLGVIKRVEIKSQRAVEGLKNEVSALLDLKGQGVPEVYDTGEAEYGSKDYFYMVVEYIDGIRVEKNIDSLTAFERAEILTQFFGILAKSHQMGIINGDVDLKHLFWRKDKKQLVVIDWGNAKLGANPRDITEFAYDLARSAEVIYSLVTRKGHPPATGTIALPGDSSLIPGLAPLPVHFYELCKWAPRTPNDGFMPPRTAQELFDASKAWQKNEKPSQPKQQLNWRLVLLFILVIIGSVLFSALSSSSLDSFFHQSTSVVVASNTSFLVTDTVYLTEAPLVVKTSTEVSVVAPTQTSFPTFTATVSNTPIPPSYVDKDTALVFDVNSSSSCLNFDTNSSNGVNDLIRNEGFYRRDSDKNWGFKTGEERSTDQFILTDFTPCLNGKSVSAIALNVWVARLELEGVSPEIPGKTSSEKEFGIFVEYENDTRRDYTIWMDNKQSMHLRVRDDQNNMLDDVVLIVNKNILNIEGDYPFSYSSFPIQFFLEINNNNLDIIYLKEGPLQLPVDVKILDPKNMKSIDWAVLPTLGKIKRIGLIGYGGNIQTVIWPLAFFGE